MVKKARTYFYSAVVIVAVSGLLMGAVFIAYANDNPAEPKPVADHPADSTHAADPVTLPPHEHAITNIPPWLTPVGLFVLGIVQVLVGVAFKQTLKNYVSKDECADMVHDCNKEHIQPLKDGSVERREKLRYIEKAIEDIERTACSNMDSINRRLALMEHQLARLTYHFLKDAGLDVRGGD